MTLPKKIHAKGHRLYESKTEISDALALSFLSSFFQNLFQTY